MTINGKTGQIDWTDLLAAGARMGLKKRKCNDIISAVSTAVSSFDKYAAEAGIRENTTAAINAVLEENRIK